MRQAVAQASHHARHRYAFGKALIDQPLMRNVLADIASVKAATALGFLRGRMSWEAQILSKLGCSHRDCIGNIGSASGCRGLP